MAGNSGARLFFVRFLLLLLTAIASVRGRFVVEKSSVSVLWPESFRGQHDAAIANFGVPNYGGTFKGALLYPSGYSTANMGCEPFASFKPPKSPYPLIVLIDRGGCFFADKVYNAQEAGAKAVLIADNVDEPLITMDTPEGTANDSYVEKINIPSALIARGFGESLKKALIRGDQVVVQIDWSESLPHPDNRVEYELWTNSNDECGIRCDDQTEFVRNFRGRAQLLEKGGFTLFTPHYITWYCPQQYVDTMQCKSQCINKGRYCAPDPEKDFDRGYEGKDVLLENLRQLCVYQVANESSRPWVWWDYVTDFHIRCSMKEKKYGRQCVEQVISSLYLSIEKVRNCMGDPDADTTNPVLETEQALQVGKGNRGDITILPTLVINDVQYRGKLESTSVLKAICSGFEEGTEPRVCLTQDLETDECLENNGGCWRDPKSNVSACKDTFRGRICQCPFVNGVQYKGDGYTKCEEAESSSRFGWFVTLLVLSGFSAIWIGGYVFYKYRLRSYMDSEIMAIMSQYMPLDNHNSEAEPLRQDTV